MKQNESPFGSPRFLVVLATTFIFLWGWQYYMNKTYPAAKPGNQQTQKVENNTSEAAILEKEKNLVEKTTKDLSFPNSANLAEVVHFYDDENVSFSISSSGFGFQNYVIKKYKDHEGKQIQFYNEAPLFSLQFEGKNIPFNISVSEDKLIYTGEANINGKLIKRVLTYNKDQQSFSSEIVIPENFDQISLQISQDKYIPKNNNFFLPSFQYQDFVYHTGEGKTKSDRITNIKEGEGLIKNVENVNMASIGSQYFVTSVVNKSDINPKLLNKVEGHKTYAILTYDLKNTKISNIKELYYLGVKKTEMLQKVDTLLPEVLNYGMFGFISKILLKLLKMIQEVVGNWGVAIIFLTIIVRTALLPFNIMSFRSARAMQKIKPQMDAVREKYKNDPMKMNQETMKIMKDNNANPVSGCLPMLLQIPIFFAFFSTISTSVELYQQPFFGWIKDLSHYDPFFILPVLMGLTMFFQQKLTPTTMDPMQAKILNFMPIIFTVFMLTLPSGLTLYNFISALFGVTQQYFLLKESKVKEA